MRALEGGAFDYLVKPFDLDQATTVVKRALEKQQGREPASGVPPRETEALDRLVAGHAGAVQEHRAGRADRRARVDHGRERNRQGAGRPGDSSPQRPARRPVPADLPGRAQSRAWSSASSSGTSRGRSPGRSRIERGCSSSPAAGPCCWTRSATSPRASRSSC